MSAIEISPATKLEVASRGFERAQVRLGHLEPAPGIIRLRQETPGLAGQSHGRMFARAYDTRAADCDHRQRRAAGHDAVVEEHLFQGNADCLRIGACSGVKLDHAPGIRPPTQLSMARLSMARVREWASFGHDLPCRRQRDSRAAGFVRHDVARNQPAADRMGRGLPPSPRRGAGARAERGRATRPICGRGSGRTGRAAIVLSGHTDVVPIDGQPWTTSPWDLTERERQMVRARHDGHEGLHRPGAGACRGDLEAAAEDARAFCILLRRGGRLRRRRADDRRDRPARGRAFGGVGRRADAVGRDVGAQGHPRLRSEDHRQGGALLRSAHGRFRHPRGNRAVDRAAPHRARAGGERTQRNRSSIRPGRR